MNHYAKNLVARSSPSGLDACWLGDHLPFTGPASSPAGCPRTLLSQVAPSGGAGYVGDDMTMEQVVMDYMLLVADRARHYS